MELGLTPNQIKFWFQNRRTQTKTEKQRDTTETLKLENIQLEKENLTLNEFLINSFCPTCDVSVVRNHHYQPDILNLRTGNLKLKQELERLSKTLEDALGSENVNLDQIESMLLLVETGSFGYLLDFNPGSDDNSSSTYLIYTQRDEQQLMTNSSEGGMTAQGRANLMNITGRMVKAFWNTIRKCEKVDFHHPIGVQNGDIRVSVHPSDESGGMIVSACSSLWLSVSRPAIFDYLNDEKSRVQWDIFTDSSSIKAIVDFFYGSYPGYRVSIFQPSSFSDNKGFIIQESRSEPVESVVVYAPVQVSWLKSVSTGEHSILPLLPVGFIIADCLYHHPDVASSSSSSMMFGGSILTMLYQIFADPEGTAKAVDFVNHVTTSTMHNIKSALGAEALFY